MQRIERTMNAMLIRTKEISIQETLAKGLHAGDGTVVHLLWLGPRRAVPRAAPPARTALWPLLSSPLRSSPVERKE